MLLLVQMYKKRLGKWLFLAQGFPKLITYLGYSKFPIIISQGVFLAIFFWSRMEASVPSQIRPTLATYPVQEMDFIIQVYQDLFQGPGTSCRMMKNKDANRRRKEKPAPGLALRQMHFQVIYIKKGPVTSSNATQVLFVCLCLQTLSK